jgi:cyclohexanecarboxylate-CoA ligase
VLLGPRRGRAGSHDQASRKDPDDVALLMFTSGTTGEPKAVMHTSNTLMATLATAIAELKITRDGIAALRRAYGPHGRPRAALGIMPLMAQAGTCDHGCVGCESGRWRWPRQDGVTFTAGATPYLTDILAACAKRASPPAALRLLCCAGSPIPPVAIERAQAELGLTVCSLWGMTEVSGRNDHELRGGLAALGGRRRPSATEHGGAHRRRRRHAGRPRT